MMTSKLVSLPRYFANFLQMDSCQYHPPGNMGNHEVMEVRMLIGDPEAMAVHHHPALGFQVNRGAGCIPFVPDHRPTGKTLLARSLWGDHSRRTGAWCEATTQ